MKTATVYDVETKCKSTIPVVELAPGMVRANVLGVGVVWVDASKISRESPYRHPAFSPEIRGLLREIKECVDEHYCRTIEDWEDGFRRDKDVEQEIAIWLRLARTYRQATEGKEMTRGQRRDYFNVLLSCVNNGREAALEVVQLSAISREEAQRLLDSLSA